MTAYEFIFSEKNSHRITRHLVFWLIFALHLFLFRYWIPDLKYLFYTTTYLIRLRNLFLFLPVSFFYAYLAIYFLLPQYILKGRYAALSIIVLLLSILLLLLSYWLSALFDIKLAFDMPLERATFIRLMDFTVSNGLVYPLTVSGFAIGIKMAKNFYTQQKENKRLAKQKINAEIQLLKSQVHPRFLFHSLNSIYKDMLEGSGQSPEMLLKLSDLLSYILYESDNELVSLDKELALLKNYTELEKSNWGDRLVINIRDNIHKTGKFIAPLLLLSLAESIFEQATKDTQKQAVLKLDIQMLANRFLFTLGMQGYARLKRDFLKENVQLIQVQKRLQVLYPGKYDFSVTENENSINISLSILLSEAT